MKLHIEKYSYYICSNISFEIFKCLSAFAYFLSDVKCIFASKVADKLSK